MTGALSGMWGLAALAFPLQASLMLIDEGFHLRRGLPRWERWGHPLDTFSAMACYLIALRAPASPAGLAAYLAAAALSCLCVTKDEWVHARHCSGAEAWLHACLFLLHPVLLAIAGYWAFGGGGPGAASGSRGGPAGFGTFLVIQTALTAAFGAWQAAYWNGPWGSSRPILVRRPPLAGVRGGARGAEAEGAVREEAGTKGPVSAATGAGPGAGQGNSGATEAGMAVPGQEAGGGNTGGTGAGMARAGRESGRG
jgi:hypothetical protein